jgi:hypothetical protein
VADWTRDVFLPAFGAAITALGGVYDLDVHDDSYLPETSWPLLPDTLQARLGQTEWQVSEADDTWIVAQYIGPDPSRRALTIQLQCVPYAEVNGVAMVRVNFYPPPVE